MSYNLFIDDERWPKDVTWGKTSGENIMYLEHEWLVARSWGEVHDLLNAYGFPDVISFDHDLGPEEVTLNGYEIAQKIVEGDMDNLWQIPSNFQYHVHSKNPVGERNIHGLLTNYLAKRGS